MLYDETSGISILLVYQYSKFVIFIFWGEIMKHFFRLILNPVNIFIIHFRSPWSNTYDPPLEDGAVPSEKLRKLEQEANVAFDQYREM